MTEKKLNTIYEFEFFDGTKTELTLTFYKLYQLKAKDKAMYDRYMKIMSKKETEELEMIELLYIAYVCSHLNDENPLITEEEFMILCGSDRRAVINAVRALTQPKKK